MKRSHKSKVQSPKSKVTPWNVRNTSKDGEKNKNPGRDLPGRVEKKSGLLPVHLLK